MQIDDPGQWIHKHDFVGEFEEAEKNTRRVLWLTAAMMVIELRCLLPGRLSSGVF